MSRTCPEHGHMFLRTQSSRSLTGSALMEVRVLWVWYRVTQNQWGQGFMGLVSGHMRSGERADRSQQLCPSGLRSAAAADSSTETKANLFESGCCDRKWSFNRGQADQRAIREISACSAATVNTKSWDLLSCSPPQQRYIYSKSWDSSWDTSVLLSSVPLIWTEL